MSTCSCHMASPKPCPEHGKQHFADPEVKAQTGFSTAQLDEIFEKAKAICLECGRGQGKHFAGCPKEFEHDCEYRSHLEHEKKLHERTLQAYIDQREMLQAQLQTLWDKLAEIREWANADPFGQHHDPILKANEHGYTTAQEEVIDMLGGGK
jgi:hypothetical protein